MGRKLNFPDPRKVIVGNPTFFASKELVVGLYNQENPGSTVVNYCQRAKDWFIRHALSIGWTHAVPEGNGSGIFLYLHLPIPYLPVNGQFLLDS